jgi:hypothetical protein
MERRVLREVPPIERKGLLDLRCKSTLLPMLPLLATFGRHVSASLGAFRKILPSVSGVHMLEHRTT